MRYVAIVVCSFSFFLKEKLLPPSPGFQVSFQEKKNIATHCDLVGWREDVQWKLSRDVFPGKNICHEILNEPDYRLQHSEGDYNTAEGGKGNRHLNKCALKHLSLYGLFKNFLPNITFNFNTSISLRCYLFYLVPRVIINCCLSAHLYAACGD